MRNVYSMRPGASTRCLFRASLAGLIHLASASGRAHGPGGLSHGVLSKQPQISRMSLRRLTGMRRCPADEFRPVRALERRKVYLQGCRLYRVPIRWRQYGKPLADDRIIHYPVERVVVSTETRTSRNWCGVAASAENPHQGRFTCQEQKRSCPSGRLFFCPSLFPEDVNYRESLLHEDLVAGAKCVRSMQKEPPA